MKIQAFFVLMLTLILVGCDKNISLMAHHGGETGSGIIHDIDTTNSSTINITLGEQVYSGQYTLTSVGGGSSMAHIHGAHLPRTATIEMPVLTNVGKAFLKSTQGQTLRCEFNYNKGAGIGICTTENGKLYDLQIN